MCVRSCVRVLACLCVRLRLFVCMRACVLVCCTKQKNESSHKIVQQRNDTFVSYVITLSVENLADLADLVTIGQIKSPPKIHFLPSAELNPANLLRLKYIKLRKNPVVEST